MQIDPFANPFENDNAKYLLDPVDVARSFVPIEDYWRLFSDKNHVVLGTRGSGKTAIARMLAHDHLCQFDHPRAKEIVETRRYVGVYAPARLNWVSGVKSQTLAHNGPEREHFILRFNFVLAQAFLISLSSCLATYIYADCSARKEFELVRNILEFWAPEVKQKAPIYTLRDLAKQVARADFRLQRARAKSVYSSPSLLDFELETAISTSFSTGIGEPIIALRDLARETFDLPLNSKFVVAIDEMEFLTAEHHTILNGLMRGETQGFVFKFVTAPYCHYTLATESNAPLIEGNDFEYVYMDHNRYVDLSALKFETKGLNKRYLFAIALFLKRLEAAGVPGGPELLPKLLGPSDVLDPEPVANADLHNIARRVMRHANNETSDRIEKKLRDISGAKTQKVKSALITSLSNELFRKMKPAVALRETIRDTVGAKKGTAYSGYAMVLACTDSNPRILIRTYNMLFPNLRMQLAKASVLVPASAQNEVMQTISQRFRTSAVAIPEVGYELDQLIERLGSFFHRKLHIDQIGTDVPASIELLQTDTDLTELVRSAVAWGFMYPHFKDEKRSALPSSGGEFRLAYTLAPYFKLLPRRGRVISARTIFPQMKIV